MTTPQEGTNKTERAHRSSGSPPDEPRHASGPERQSSHAAYKEVALVRAHTTGEQEGTGSKRRLPRVGVRLGGAASCGTC